MDRHFWPRISRMCAQSFERVKDVKRQVHGIDVVIGRAYVDEKAKVRGCLNKPVQNLAFELGFKGRDCAWHDGWLCNPAMATTHYAVIDVFTEKELGEKALPGLSDISKVNVLLFKKSDLWKRALRDMPLCLLMSKVEDMRWTS